MNKICYRVAELSLRIPKTRCFERVRHRTLSTTRSARGVAGSRRESNLRRRNANVKVQSYQTGAPPPRFPAIVEGEVLGPYGLTRVDYSTPPPRWPMPPHPPPSPSATRRFFPHVLLLSCISMFGWIYMNQDSEVYEYWRQVEQGKVPIMSSDYDDDGEEEEDDDGVDEWADEADKSVSK
jgi:hypothetical protein